MATILFCFRNGYFIAIRSLTFTVTCLNVIEPTTMLKKSFFVRLIELSTKKEWMWDTSLLDLVTLADGVIVDIKWQIILSQTNPICLSQGSQTRGPREGPMLTSRKNQFLKAIWPIFSICSQIQNIIFHFFQCGPRDFTLSPVFESHAARESLWVWDPWSKSSNDWLSHVDKKVN